MELYGILIIYNCNIIIFGNKMYISVNFIQLCECSHTESQFSCMLSNWTHCTVLLDNIDIKAVKVTVVLRLLHWSGQFIVQCIHQLVCTYYKIFSIVERKNLYQFLFFVQNNGITVDSWTNRITPMIRISTSAQSLHSTASKHVTSHIATCNKHTQCCWTVHSWKH